MPERLNPVIVQFLCGRTFFAGIGLCIVLCGALLSGKRKALRSFFRILFLFGVLLVAFSATPLAWGWYTLWGGALVLAWWAVERKEKAGKLFRRISVAVFVGCSALLVALEAPYHLQPQIDVDGSVPLYVVGDSLSMGADPPDRSWPQLLGERLGLEANNYSFGGARVATALSNAKRIQPDKALVILEIGGNDLLGGTGIPQVQEALEAMLQAVCKPSRQVLIIELPLLPGFNRFGMVQRRLAKQYGVTLIPKYYLTHVLGSPGATVDGLHLSNAGHAHLAETVAELLSISK